MIFLKTILWFVGIPLRIFGAGMFLFVRALCEPHKIEETWRMAVEIFNGDMS